MKKNQTIIILSCFLALSFKIYGQASVFVEDFEDGIIPETWTTYDLNGDGRRWESDSRTSVSGEWCAGVSASMDGTKCDWIITPAVIPNATNNTISFFAKSQVPLPEYLEDFKVKVSVTNTLPESFTDLIGEETSIAAEWLEYTYDLSAYQGQQIYIAIINESFNKSVMFIDDISAPYFYFDNDLRITSLEGSTTPMMGSYESYYVTIENNGWQSQSNYQVILYENDGTIITTVEGESIESFQRLVVPMEWIPEEAIATKIYAEIIFEADENQSNNRSKDWYVSVRTVDMLTIVNGTFLKKEYTPLFFPAKTSLSESIYLAEDIGVMGNIIEIAYYADFQFEVREKNIRIWIGETNMTELDMEWIPASELTLVYDGQITIPKYDHMIPIRFDTAYRYTGGNLVVMVERSWDEQMYGYDNQFKISETSRFSTIQYEQNFEPTDPDNPSVDPYWTQSARYMPGIHFIFDVSGMGSLTGVVTDQNNDSIGDVTIFSDEVNLVAKTNTDGQYNIPYIFEGEYNFHAAKHGYYGADGQVTIMPNQPHQLNFQITGIPEVAVSGKVVGNDNPLEGIPYARVLLNGYDNYETVTDELGDFIFPEVYCNNTYSITVDAEGYQRYTGTVDVEEQAITLNYIILIELTPPPIQVTATDLNMLASVSWIEPYGIPENEFRYDDGNVDMQIGFEVPLPNSIMGAAFSANSIIKSVSWYLTDEEDHDSVKIVVLGLDMMGKPDASKIYYQSGMIPNIDNQWNTIDMPKYIDAPEGFFVGVNTPNQFISLGTDDGTGEPYEFHFGTYYVNTDWTAGNEWVDAGDLGCNRNMMIRANGYKFGYDKTTSVKRSPAQPNITLSLSKVTQSSAGDNFEKSNNVARDLEKYHVFRLKKGDEEFENRWETLSTSFTGTYYEDYSWETLVPGSYRYAIKAEYSNGLLSYARISNEVIKKETVKVTISVTTNSSDPVTGAKLDFNSTQGYPGFSYSTILDESGSLVLNSVPKDTYKIDLSLAGFAELHVENIDIQSDTTLTYELNEIFKNPYNLMVDVSQGNALFSWNNKPNAVTQDFEEFEDFTLDFGDWTTLNNDGVASLKVNEINFPHNGENLGFIVFNPEATVPQMMDIYAYSGHRCAAAITAKEGESSDWLISPKTGIIEGTVFKFMARSTSDMWELSSLRVKVSTTGQSPEDFTTIPEFEYIIAPYWSWSEFIVDLSEYAGQDIYVAIEHISIESYILLIDDLFIGVPEPTERSLIDYTVYLDGVLTANTTEKNYTFSNLVHNQTYIAGVRANYTTGTSEIKTIEFEAQNTIGFDEGEEMQVSFYPNPSKGIIKMRLENSEEAVLQIYDASGKVVFSESYHGKNMTITLPGLSKGLYLANVLLPGKTISQKLIVN